MDLSPAIVSKSRSSASVPRSISEMGGIATNRQVSVES